jgi:putative acetyltransferase
MVTVRKELAADVAAIRLVNESAFDSPTEANLVDKLRTSCPDAISLVAVCENKVIGHILFSPVSISAAQGGHQGMGLAPMAVLPEYQRKGVGSRMIEDGLRLLRAQGCPFVIVLGHPDYYPRFGFVPASTHSVSCEWAGIPEEAFMVFALDEAIMSEVSGVARYREEFDEAM